MITNESVNQARSMDGGPGDRNIDSDTDDIFSLQREKNFYINI